VGSRRRGAGGILWCGGRIEALVAEPEFRDYHQRDPPVRRYHLIDPEAVRYPDVVITHRHLDGNIAGGKHLDKDARGRLAGQSVDAGAVVIARHDHVPPLHQLGHGPGEPALREGQFESDISGR